MQRELGFDQVLLVMVIYALRSALNQPMDQKIFIGWSTVKASLAENQFSFVTGGEL
jgi:hypothetical protein